MDDNINFPLIVIGWPDGLIGKAGISTLFENQKKAVTLIHNYIIQITINNIINNYNTNNYFKINMFIQTICNGTYVTFVKLQSESWVYVSLLNEPSRQQNMYQVRVLLSYLWMLKISFSKHNFHERSAPWTQTSWTMRQLKVISSLVKRQTLFPLTWDFAFTNCEQNVGPRNKKREISWKSWKRMVSINSEVIE